MAAGAMGRFRTGARLLRSFDRSSAQVGRFGAVMPHDVVAS